MPSVRRFAQRSGCQSQRSRRPQRCRMRFNCSIVGGKQLLLRQMNRGDRTSPAAEGIERGIERRLRGRLCLGGCNIGFKCAAQAIFGHDDFEHGAVLRVFQPRCCRFGPALRLGQPCCADAAI